MRNILETIAAVIKQPTKFFKSIAKEKGIKDAVLFWVFIFAVNFVLSAVYYFRVNAFSYWAILKVVTLPLVVGLIFLFVLIVHGFFKLFKGQGKYKDTFNLLVYTSVPNFLLGILANLVRIIAKPPATVETFSALGWPLMIFNMVIVLISLVWTLFLATKGGSILHKVRKVQSFLAVFVLPVLAIMLIMLLLGMLFSLGIFASVFMAKMAVPVQSLV